MFLAARAVLLFMRAREDFGSGRATHDKGLVYPIVACALSSVVVSAASRFVALCCRPCRAGIADRDKLLVSYLLSIFS